MSILAVGSVAFDSVKTPFGEATDVLGGSATFFAVAASFFTDVNLVAVVGEDFTDRHLEVFGGRRIDLRGLQRVPGQTFRWGGEYSYDLNNRTTTYTHLNVFEHFNPLIPEAYRESEVVFLGNIHPTLQRQVLEHVAKPSLVAADTMNYWIERTPAELRALMPYIDVLIVNDAEVRQLANEPSLVRASRHVLAMGPKTLVIKRGEHGALMASADGFFSAPALPIENVFDPTGAGDAFAGGFVGYLASVPEWPDDALRRAIIFGSVLASFCVEDFSLRRLEALTWPEIAERYRTFKRLTHFEDL